MIKSSFFTFSFSWSATFFCFIPFFFFYFTVLSHFSYSGSNSNNKFQLVFLLQWVSKKSKRFHKFWSQDVCNLWEDQTVIFSSNFSMVWIRGYQTTFVKKIFRSELPKWIFGTHKVPVQFSAEIGNWFGISGIWDDRTVGIFWKFDIL